MTIRDQAQTQILVIIQVTALTMDQLMSLLRMTFSLHELGILFL